MRKPRRTNKTTVGKSKMSRTNTNKDKLEYMVLQKKKIPDHIHTQLEVRLIYVEESVKVKLLGFDLT